MRCGRKVTLTANRQYQTDRRKGVLVELQRHYTRVSIGQLESPVLHQIMAIWDAKREGRPYPARNDLRPQDFAPFLRLLALLRVVENDDFELRIVGDGIVQAYGENFTGRRLSSVADAIGSAMTDAYRAVVREGSSVVLQGTFGMHDQQSFPPRSYSHATGCGREGGICPIGGDAGAAQQRHATCAKRSSIAFTGAHGEWRRILGCMNSTTGGGCSRPKSGKPLTKCGTSQFLARRLSGRSNSIRNRMPIKSKSTS